MKLLHLTNAYPPYSTGSTERQCRLLVHELANRGHMTRVLTAEHTLASVSDREAFAQRRLRLESPATGASFERLLLDEWRNRRALREMVEEMRPDVVLVWGMSGLSNSLLWEAERLGLRIAFAVLDRWPRNRLREDPWFHWWTTRLAFRQWFVRYTLRLSGFDRPLLHRFPVRRATELKLNRGFFISRALRDSTRAAGFAVEGSEVISGCLSREEIPPQPQRRDDLRRLLWIGNLDADRDPMTAIQAVQELRHEGEMRFSLDIFGRGELGHEARLHDYVRDAQLGGAVNIRHASVEEMVALFSTYDVFLHTARHPEPFPFVLLRAMAARLPVISTLEGSCAEVLRKGENALVFRTGDPVDCAARILEIGSDRALLDHLTERAYRDVLDNFSAPVVASRIERLLADLVRQR